jgi:predicted nucleotidyltransferase
MHILSRDVVRQAMKRKGFRTLQELARHLGAHRNTLSNYLARTPVLPKKLEELLSVLEIPLQEALIEVCEEKDRDDMEGLDEVVDKLHEQFPKVTLVLFGSRARKTNARYSDVDLGVYSKSGLSHPEYRSMRIAVSEAAERLPLDIDLVNLNRAEHSFLVHVVRDGKVVAGRQSDWVDLQRKVQHV